MCATRNQSEVPENFYIPPHGRSRNWYVRLVPPRALQGTTGVGEFRKSTGTADLRRAKAIGAGLIAAKRAEWEELLIKLKSSAIAPRILTPEVIEHICGRRLYHWMRLDDEGRFEGDGYDDSMRGKLTEMAEVTDRAMRSVIVSGKMAPEWSEVLDVIDFWCNQIECPVERSDPLYPQLLRAFAEVECEGADRLIRRNRGEPVATPAKPATIGPSLSAMTEPYREYKEQNSGAKHVGTSVNIWSQLIEYLGDVQLSAVKAADLYGFLEFQMRDADKRWSMDRAHGIAKRTLREVFGLARTRGLLEGENPVDGMEVLPLLGAEEERSRKKPRLPFSDAQLTTVFTSEWYQSDTNRFRGKMGDDLGARYWVPLICLFHGNRVREVLQLVASDIGTSGTLPVLHFRVEVEGKQAELSASGAKRSLKNPQTKRTVPVHPTLCALGFVEFVEQRREADGEHAMLFPSSLPEPGGKNPMLGRAYEQAFLRYVKYDLGFGSGFGNHSFRHQLEDRIRDAQRPGYQWPAGMGQAYTGRKRTREQDVGTVRTESSESAYGKGYSPAMMLEYVKTLAFDQVTMPPAFALWLVGVKTRA
jgi:hypothetical protein